jgi:hypothetical protein
VDEEHTEPRLRPGHTGIAARMKVDDTIIDGLRDEMPDLPQAEGQMRLRA